MKKLLFILLLALTFAACNNGECGKAGEAPCDQFGCKPINKSELTDYQRTLLLTIDWDSTKPKIVQIDGDHCITVMP